MFTLYLAVLTLSLGLATLVNSRLVAAVWMHKMVLHAAAGQIIFSVVLLAASLSVDLGPGFVLFMILQFMMQFCMELVFGNLGALAMQPLGRIAGLGTSLMAAASSLIAVSFTTLSGWFYEAIVLPLALGYAVAGVATLLFLRRGYSTDLDLVCPVDLSGASAPN